MCGPMYLPSGGLQQYLSQNVLYGFRRIRHIIMEIALPHASIGEGCECNLRARNVAPVISGCRTGSRWLRSFAAWSASIRFAAAVAGTAGIPAFGSVAPGDTPAV